MGVNTKTYQQNSDPDIFIQFSSVYSTDPQREITFPCDIQHAILVKNSSILEEAS